MSTNRTRPDAGWADPKALPRGPNGRALCRWCKGEIPRGRRRTFCSETCVHEWKLRSQPGYLRACVFARDDGICARCGLDTKAFDLFILDNELAGIRFSMRAAERKGDHDRLARVEAELAGWFIRRQAAVLWRLKNNIRASVWEANHVLAVVEGGGEVGLDGVETLCCPCHRTETAVLAGRRARARKGAGSCS